MPTVLIQALQRVLHARLIVPVLDERWTAPSRRLVGLVSRFPELTVLPAYLIGLGPLPERAPAWARRPARITPTDNASPVGSPASS